MRKSFPWGGDRSTASAILAVAVLASILVMPICVAGDRSASVEKAAFVVAHAGPSSHIPFVVQLGADLGQQSIGASVTRQEEAHALDDTIFHIRVQMAFTALTLAFALLHIILYLYLPALRSNLYFALFLFFHAVAIFFDFQQLITGLDWQLRLQRATWALSLLFFLRFFYELFLPKLPFRFWLFSGGFILAGLLGAIEPRSNHIYLIIMTGLQWIEVSRVDIQAIRRGREDAGIIAVGIGVLFLFTSYDALLDVGLIGTFREIENAYQFGLVGLFITSSIYLARDMARTSDRLIVQERQSREQELERRILEADVARKTRELEDARDLQLSMLPRTLPELPSLEIAVHMETATEVGGDYYDFHHDEDETLTVAVGDATGHGLKAGIMVAIAKSLFHGAAAERDIPRYFDRCTGILKQMRLGNLFMGLTLLRIRHGSVVASAAGMPPMLIYRADAGEVETVTLKGMPLGAFEGFPYQQFRSELLPGDTILIMSDGFVELFNAEREMLGLSRTRTLYLEAAKRAPQEIITHLCEAGAAWRDHQALEDDMTIVVVKVRS